MDLTHIFIVVLGIVNLLVSSSVSVVDRLNYDEKDLSREQINAIEAARQGDGRSLNTLGTALTGRSMFGDPNLPLALDFFKEAATKGSVSAAYNVGNAYSQGGNWGVEKNSEEAFRWFKIAAQSGHAKALFNCGILLSGEGPFSMDPLASLEYFRAAFLASENNYKDSELTDAASAAHSVMSEAVAELTLSGDDLDRAWRAGHLQEDLPEESDIQALWKKGLQSLRSFNESFITRKGAINRELRIHLNNSMTAFVEIMESHANQLGRLQGHLVLDNLQDMLGPLVGAGGDGKTGSSANTHLVRLAARYAEAYALSPLCIRRVAKKESDAACFNGAASAAMSYYSELEMPQVQ